MKAFCLTSQCCPLEELPPGVEETALIESADLLIVAGPINAQKAYMIRELYDRMPLPRNVVALGACAQVLGAAGAACAVPVDVYVPGCPPEKKDMVRAVDELKSMIRRSERTGEDV